MLMKIIDAFINPQKPESRSRQLMIDIPTALFDPLPNLQNEKQVVMPLSQ